MQPFRRGKTARLGRHRGRPLPLSCAFPTSRVPRCLRGTDRDGAIRGTTPGGGGTTSPVGRPPRRRGSKAARANEASPHRAGGVASLAHPGVDKLTFALHRFKEMGIDSVEINHPAHRPVTKRELQLQVTRLNLLTSGGSDMHEHKGASIIGAEGIDPDELAALEMKANDYRKQNGMAEYVQ